MRFPDEWDLAELAQPFFPNGAHIALEDLQSIPELRSLLADGRIVRVRLVLVAEVSRKSFFPLTQKQILTRLFVAFGFGIVSFLISVHCLMIRDKITFSERRRALGLILLVVMGSFVVIRRMSKVFFSLLVDEGLEHLLVLDEVSRGVVEGSVRRVTMNAEVGGVNGPPFVIQASKCGDQVNDGLQGVGYMLRISIMIESILDHCGLIQLLVSFFWLLVLP